MKLKLAAVFFALAAFSIMSVPPSVLSAAEHAIPVVWGGSTPLPVSTPAPAPTGAHGAVIVEGVSSGTIIPVTTPPPTTTVTVTQATGTNLHAVIDNATPIPTTTAPPAFTNTGAGRPAAADGNGVGTISANTNTAFLATQTGTVYVSSIAVSGATAGQFSIFKSVNTNCSTNDGSLEAGYYGAGIAYVRGNGTGQLWSYAGTNTLCVNTTTATSVDVSFTHF